MRLIHVPEDPPPAQPPPVVAVIGNFDGVHRGHRALIGHAIRRAAELGVQSAVVTFDPHPRLVLRPDEPLRLLSPLEEKAELLAQLGVDHLLVWRFDRQTQQTSAEQFLEQLGRRVHLRRLVHGPGFALGRQRKGTPELLAEIGGWLGFDVEGVSPVADQASGIVSSSAIRAMVGAGQVRQATAALVRPPALSGTVVHGEQVGRQLGFPTANLEVAGPLAVPGDGVYSGWAELAPWTPRAQRLPAAISIGMRPQFGGLRRVVEAYLLDFSGDLYGQTVRLHFVTRLRGQERFSGVDALVRQIKRDVDTTRAVLLAPGHDQADQHLLAADG